jgi:hypothetical protein
MTDKQRRNQHRIKMEFAHKLAIAVKLISFMIPRLDNHPVSKVLEQGAYKLIKSIQDIKK